MKEKKKRDSSNRKLRPDLEQYKFKAREFNGEPCNYLWAVRLPDSLKERMNKFKEETGRMPNREIRHFLDDILPQLDDE